MSDENEKKNQEKTHPKEDSAVHKIDEKTMSELGAELNELKERLLRRKDKLAGIKAKYG